MNKSGFSSQAVLTIRVIIGAYLIYIDYSVWNYVSEQTGGKKIALILLLALFALAGSALIVTSLIALWKDYRASRENKEDDGSAE